MMREEVRVVAVDGDYAEVVGYRQSGCAGCRAKASCAMVAGSSAGQETRLWALNAVGAEVGEWVTLEITERQFLRASFLVYILPLVFLLVAAGAVSTLLLPYATEDVADAGGAVAGVLAMAVFFWWLRRHTHGPGAKGRFQPVLARSRGDVDSFHCDDQC